MKEKLNRENLVGVAIIIAIVGCVSLGAWWLVKMNSGSGGGASREDKKGAITEGLQEGKDYGTDYAENEQAVFEALVVLRDQKYTDPEEDRRSALKRGDVLAIRKSPHLWSDTERTSYLVVKIEMTGKEANELVARDTDRNGTPSHPRKKKIDLDAIGFTGANISGNQPFEEKVFEENIIVKR